MEGEKLTLTCTGFGSDVKFNWTIGRFKIMGHNICLQKLNCPFLSRWQGDKVTSVHFYFTGNVSYTQSTETVELKTDFNEEKKIHIATLALNDTKLEDRGEYTCIGYNLISDSKSTTLVRVKGKLENLGYYMTGLVYNW